MEFDSSDTLFPTRGNRLVSRLAVLDKFRRRCRLCGFDQSFMFRPSIQAFFCSFSSGLRDGGGVRRAVVTGLQYFGGITVARAQHQPTSFTSAYDSDSRTNMTSTVSGFLSRQPPFAIQGSFSTVVYPTVFYCLVLCVNDKGEGCG